MADVAGLTLAEIQQILFQSNNNATAIYTGADFRIEFANQAMLNLWGKQKNIIGMRLLDAIPEIVHQAQFRKLQTVWKTGQTVVMRDTPVEFQIKGKLTSFYFDAEYRAMSNDTGNVYAILHTAVEVSDRIEAWRLVEEKSISEQQLTQELMAMNEEYQATNEELSSLNEEYQSTNETLAALNEEYQATNEELNKLNEEFAVVNEELTAYTVELSFLRRKLEEANEHLGASNENLLNENTRLDASERKALAMLDDAPVAIALLSGKKKIIESANTMMRDLLNRDEQIIGKEIIKAIPEIAKQPFIETIDEVFQSAEAYQAKHLQLFIERNGKLVKGFYDIALHPLKNVKGETETLMFVAHDVTEQVKAQSTVEESERKIKTLIEQAAVAIIVFRGDKFVIDSVNPQMLQLLDKNNDIIGKPLLLAIPELLGQQAFEMLFQVYKTGKPYYGNETEVKLRKNGKIETGYYNFTYTPLIEDGKITGIIDTAVEVTDQVYANRLIKKLNADLALANTELSETNEQVQVTNEMLRETNESLLLSRKQVEQSELMLRLAVDAANFGTWNVNFETKELRATSRFKRLFGFQPDEEININKCLMQITPDFREPIKLAFELALAQKNDFDQSFTIIGQHDQRLRWIRCIGNLILDETGTNISFTGVVMDITEQKKDEQRKNDFIGMVSHELKTPLTSLGGYIQLLQRTTVNKTDKFIIGALEKAGQQVKKMTAMINGFLNLSRLESGKIHLERDTFELNKLVAEIIGELTITSTGYHITLTSATAVNVVADRDKIGNVITNLLSNAIKYSPDNKNIEVVCEKRDNEVQVLVTDHGIGIKPENLPNLFDRFYRVEGKQTKMIAGFGIGLYLSAEIIERHGGKIWAESTLGEGSTVGFSLPV